jgi:phytoene dehydrogenase-like protein
VVNANILVPKQSYPHRPPIACPDVKRLYFIGDTVQSEGCSGDIAFSSALRLAELI